jgi:hypothetical protein
MSGFSNGPVLGCPAPAEINHLKTVLVQYSDGDCTVLSTKFIRSEKFSEKVRKF